MVASYLVSVKISTDIASDDDDLVFFSKVASVIALAVGGLVF